MKKIYKSYTKKDNKRAFDKKFKLQQGIVISKHTILILLFLIAALISGFFAFYYIGTIWGTLALSFAVAFVTATIVDFAYNYVVMKDISELVAEHLMLNEEVQDKIMKKEKIDEIFSLSLKKVIGEKLAMALKSSIIDKIASEKDLFLMERAYYSVVLKNFSDDDLKKFFEVEMISKFNMTLKSNKVIFYATDSDKIYDELVQKSNDPNIYLTYYLPDGCGQMLKANKSLLEKFLVVSEILIDGKSLTKSNLEWKYDGEKNILSDVLPAVNGWASYVDTNLSKDACMIA